MRGYEWASMVRRQCRCSSSARHVLLTLATYADDDGHASPSLETLASDTGYSLRTLRYAVSELAADHWLDRVGGVGRGNALTYRLLCTDERSARKAAENDTFSEKGSNAASITGEKVPFLAAFEPEKVSNAAAFSREKRQETTLKAAKNDRAYKDELTRELTTEDPPPTPPLPTAPASEPDEVVEVNSPRSLVVWTVNQLATRGITATPVSEDYAKAARLLRTHPDARTVLRHIRGSPTDAFPLSGNCPLSACLSSRGYDALAKHGPELTRANGQNGPVRIADLARAQRLARGVEEDDDAGA